jgi:hypothetical protein
MSSPRYVWEKMYVAIDCLCKEGSFNTRLYNATVSALMRLEDNDLTGDLAEDLKHILDWTKRNITEGSLQREPDELERNELIEKMLHVLLETTRN